MRGVVHEFRQCSASPGFRALSMSPAAPSARQSMVPPFWLAILVYRGLPIRALARTIDHPPVTWRSRNSKRWPMRSSPTLSKAWLAGNARWTLRLELLPRRAMCFVPPPRVTSRLSRMAASAHCCCVIFWVQRSAARQTSLPARAAICWPSIVHPGPCAIHGGQSTAGPVKPFPIRSDDLTPHGPPPSGPFAQHLRRLIKGRRRESQELSAIKRKSAIIVSLLRCAIGAIAAAGTIFGRRRFPAMVRQHICHGPIP
jgi:hypothetical protein